MADFIFKGGIGITVTLEVEIDVSASTTRTMKYRKPSGVIGSWDGTKGSDNRSIYFITTAATDLDESGDWKLQAYVITPSWTHHGGITKMNVMEPLF